MFCLLCGTVLKVQPRGRPRRFCSPAHRVRYHRLHKRTEDGGALTASSQAERGSNDRIKILDELAGILGDLRPPGHVAQLRHLAEQATSLSILFDTIEESAWALDKLSEVQSAVEWLLRDHRSTLRRLSDLDDLADDVEEFTRALHETRCYQDDLEWAIEALEAPNDAES